MCTEVAVAQSQLIGKPQKSFRAVTVLLSMKKRDTHFINSKTMMSLKRTGATNRKCLQQLRICRSVSDVEAALGYDVQKLGLEVHTPSGDTAGTAILC
ncbi:hypothetical protein T06_427 [Trichinella sp. T6]|nr:hypothetical protein T06_427 [Trichinella sp. T6]